MSEHERQRIMHRLIHDLGRVYDLPQRGAGEPDEAYLMRAVQALQRPEPTADERLAGKRGQQAGQWREQPWRDASGETEAG